MVDVRSGHWSVKAMYVSLGVAIVGMVFTFAGGGSANAMERAYVCMGCGEITNMSIEDIGAITREKNLEYIETVEKTNPEMGKILRQALESPGTLPPQMRMVARFPSWGSVNFPLVCPACGDEALVEAYKCPKCGKAFCPYKEDGKFDDTCPACKYSLKEATKK